MNQKINKNVRMTSKLKSNSRIPLITMLLSLCISKNIIAQGRVADTSQFIILKASEKYNKKSGYQKRWGKHYRTEWNTLVTFRKAYIDTLAGGLNPYQQGGGRQSKSLRLRDKQQREYVLRSVDKSFGNALPEIAKGTFIESIVNDQASSGHPYAALTIPIMAEASGVYHTNPSIYYLPKQDQLGKFNDPIGNDLYLFEQRPDENWETAANFGFAKNIIGTEKLFEKLREDNDVRVDQLLFVRSRLFDMFIGDWGRHEDQWRWGEFKVGKKTTYKPIPRDRDQAYTKFDGGMLRILISVAGLKHLQTFDHLIKDVATYNFPARNLDHHLTNEVSRREWIQIAKELQSALTDKIIDAAILQLPTEVYNISGPEIAAKLKARRNQLTEIADVYFKTLAYETDITGTKDREHFDINRLNDSITEIKIYKISKDDSVAKDPLYHRLFDNRETKEIRLFGMDGEDQFNVKGKVNTGIKLRLIGGQDRDDFTDESDVKKGGHRTKIYDDRNNTFIKSDETALRLSSDTSHYAYKYEAVEYDKEALRPILFYNNEDRIYGGIAYTYQKHQWSKKPYGFRHYIDLKYSLSQKAFSTTYENRYPQLAGKWDLNTAVNYDQIRWTNFYGLGNNSNMLTSDRNFYRLRTHEFYGSVGIERTVNNKLRFSVVPFFQTIKIVLDTARFVPKYLFNYPTTTPHFVTEKFAGLNTSFVYQVLNDSILPTRGFGILTNIKYTENLTSTDKSFTQFGAELNLYVPLSRTISIASKVGVTTLAGKPQFYQYGSIGGSRSLRGYQRNRFYGKSTFYNQNELRLIKDVRSHLYNGKIGVFGLYDLGRVWIDNEVSNKWHYGYGGGMYISPFNRIAVSASYALSEDDKQLHLSVIKTF